MKKAQKAVREFDQLKSQLPQIRFTVNGTKDTHLWNHEVVVRKKLRQLNSFRDKQLKEFTAVYNGYLQLLDLISRRLLNLYNKENRTQYDFDEVVAKNKDGYIGSGIISVLITNHIPEMVAEAFKKYFPSDPKDEYENARRLSRKIVLHLGDTNTGKTYQALERLKQSEKGAYLAPLRILALENFERLNREGLPCNLITGEEEILVENARHVCSTIEKLDIYESYEVAIIDEIQMIADTQRGFAWTRALLGLNCAEIHICGAMNARALITKILDDCKDAYEVKEYKRQTPLEVLSKPFELKDAAKGDALVAFSKKHVLELSKHFLDRGVKNSVIYGDLPPEVRRTQYHAFISGENSLLITTDAIGMGVNLPIRRIVFMDLMKFDGEERRYLTSQEIKQIAGRAGRKGIYDVGYVGTAGMEYLFLNENLEMRDEPLAQAVVGPSEAIIKIKGLPLKEKLALWSTRREGLDYYRKMDVRDYLIILDAIKFYKLPEATEFRLLQLPFNVNDPDLKACFINYLEEYFVLKRESLSRPEASWATLSDCEKYYQKLNLYYSFSKNFNIGFDPDWVYAERAKTSEKINKLLLAL